MEPELRGLLADQTFEERDPGLVFLDRDGCSGVLVEDAGRTLVDSDPDRGVGQVVAEAQAVERLVDEILLNDLVTWN